MKCDLSQDRLWAWVHGEDDAPTSIAEIAAHVGRCEACRRAAAEMRSLVDDLADMSLLAGKAPAESAAAVPKQIGEYLVVRRIGQGGMGVVFEAEQQTPRRRVALKVVRPGHAVDDYRVRLFKREMQALARLNHPAIATIYDAGTTDDGQHYFAMELVEGVELGPYVDGLRGHGTAPEPPLAPRERLRLFSAICAAIGYAHQRGVIHRDLKPSNILVTPDGTPKVLDFGLARAIEPDAQASMAESQSGGMVGTLPYMSPEQARGETDALDVRSDVYALGVILYELMTGQLPYDLLRLRLFDAIRAINECVPAPPQSFNAAIPGDVATIVLKALEKSPERRYQTAAELEDDVKRFLEGYPILARPPSRLYRFRKMVGRHKLAFSLVGAIFIVVSGSALLFAIQRDIARQEAQKFEEMFRFQADVLASANPYESGARARDAKVIDILGAYERELDRKFANRPLVAAALRNVLGNTYRAFDEVERAERHLRFAYETRLRLLGTGHRDAVQSRNDLGEMLFWKGELDEAEKLLRETLDLRREHFPADRAAIAESVNSVGLLLHRRGRYDEAERLFGESLRLREELAQIARRDGVERAALETAYNGVAQTKNNLAVLHRARAATARKAGDARAAEEALQRAMRFSREALQLREEWLGRHPETGKMHNNYALCLEDHGDLPEAEHHLREASAILAAELGESHTFTARTNYHLARITAAQGRREEAIRYCRMALAVQRDLLSSGDAQLAQTEALLGELEK